MAFADSSTAKPVGSSIPLICLGSTILAAVRTMWETQISTEFTLVHRKDSLCKVSHHPNVGGGKGLSPFLGNSGSEI
jgi:hypothetical protein